MRRPVLLLILIGLVMAFGCDSPEELHARAQTALIEKRYDDAIADLEKAVNIWPNEPDLHFLLGQAYRHKLFGNVSQINAVNAVYARPASRAFEIAMALIPRYRGEDLLGDTYATIQDIWGAVAMTHAYQGALDSARWAFRSARVAGAFYPGVTEYTRDVLRSCAPGAILLFNDNQDAFPAWYLQLVDGFRPDITVINLDLLNESWYIRMTRDRYPFGDAGVTLRMSDGDIDDMKAQAWDPHHIEIPMGSGTLEWDLYPTVEDRYIRVQDLILVDILTANQGRRPVYFAASVQESNRIGLKPFLHLEGLLFRLDPTGMAVSPEVLISNLMSTYQFEGLSDPRLEHIGSLQALYHNYRLGYMAMARYALRSGQPDLARQVLDRMDQTLPPSRLPYPNFRFALHLKELENAL